MRPCLWAKSGKSPSWTYVTSISSLQRFVCKHLFFVPEMLHAIASQPAGSVCCHHSKHVTCVASLHLRLEYTFSVKQEVAQRKAKSSSTMSSPDIGMLQIENFDQTTSTALQQWDDHEDLSSYDFDADRMQAPDNDDDKRKLAYR